MTFEYPLQMLFRKEEMRKGIKIDYWEIIGLERKKRGILSEQSCRKKYKQNSCELWSIQTSLLK